VSGERIGVAYDGTDEAKAALATAAELAAALGARLEVIGVITPDFWETPSGVEALMTPYEELAHAVRVGLDDALASLSDGIEAEAVLLAGEPAARLAERSAALDLLVTGSRGHGPLRSAIVGSVSRRLTRTAHCPVIVVPHGTGRFTATRAAGPR